MYINLPKDSTQKVLQLAQRSAPMSNYNLPSTFENVQGGDLTIRTNSPDPIRCEINNTTVISDILTIYDKPIRIIDNNKSKFKDVHYVIKPMLSAFVGLISYDLHEKQFNFDVKLIGASLWDIVDMY